MYVAKLLIETVYSNHHKRMAKEGNYMNYSSNPRDMQIIYFTSVKAR